MLKAQLEDFLEKYKIEVDRSAEVLLGEEMPQVTEELFALFEQTGNRLRYEEVYFARRKFLAVLGIKAVMLAGQGRPGNAGDGASGNFPERKAFFGKLAEVLRDICGEECWALPAHVDRSGNPDWRITVDLFAAETAQTLAELVDRVGRYLPEDICALVVHHVEGRVLFPFFSSLEPYSGWERGENNWNAVCSGAIGSACIHLMNWNPGRFRNLLEEISRRREASSRDSGAPALSSSDCLDRICRALVYYLRGFSEEGVCTEGLGYYTYGMTYFVNFAQELYEYTGGEKDLFCGEWGGFKRHAGRMGPDASKEFPGQVSPDALKEHAGRTSPDGGEEGGILGDKRFRIAQFPVKCFWQDGRSVSFSDGSSHESFRVGICSVCALHYGRISPSSESGTGWLDCADLFPGFSGAAGLHTDSCYRFAALKLDLVYTEALLRALENVRDHGGTVRNYRETAQNPEGDAQVFGKQIFGEQVFGIPGKDAGKGCRSYFLPSAQWYIANARSGVGFACKGGHNAESHNHNDIGHFIYEADGTFFFTDLGAGEYTKEYFGKGRYDILCNNSFGHSVPILNGQGQGTGREFYCDRFYKDPEAPQEVECLTLELHSAYQKGVLERFRREFAFHMGTGELRVRDHFEYAQESLPKILENLVTRIFPTVEGNRVLLRKGSSCCILEIGHASPDIQVKEYLHYNHRGIPEKVYAIQWRVSCADGEARAEWGIHLRNRA